MECKCRSIFFIFAAAIIATLFYPTVVLSQSYIKGRVVYERDNAPAAYASVELLNQKSGALTDQAGSFSLHVSRQKKDDTLQISMVGYETLKVPVAAALSKKEFVLAEKNGSLENVTVRTFSTHDVQGSTSESVGYFRSWNTEKTGGEIGRMFRLPYKEFKIDKVRFKVSNMCDTCLIRLHIRNVVNGNPGEDILKDSITTTIHKLTIDDKTPEFDISEHDITFKGNQVFVSLEVLNCRSKTNEACYFSFAGSERGEYIYKSKAAFDWQTFDDYTIYLKLFLRH